MPAAQRSSSGKETQPLLQPRSPSAGVGPGTQAPPVQTSIGRPSPKFLGLYLWQWALVGLAALCLYGIYLVGAALAWRHGKFGAAPPRDPPPRADQLVPACASSPQAGSATTTLSSPSAASPGCVSRGLLLRVVAVSVFARAPSLTTPLCVPAPFRPQAWCLVQIAHTLCCPGLMFTTVDTEGPHTHPVPGGSLPGGESRERMEGPTDRV
jgi:hypothetical protein